MLNYSVAELRENKKSIAGDRIIDVDVSVRTEKHLQGCRVG